MSKYYLGFRSNGVVESIDINKLDILKDKNTTDIKTIDDFTKRFDSMGDLTNFLKNNNLLDQYINILFIAKVKKEKEYNTSYKEKIYKGEFLFFKEDEKYLELSYLCKFIRDNFKDGNFIETLADNYYKKYNGKRNGPSYISSVLLTLLRISRKIKVYGYDVLTGNEKEEYLKCIDSFIIFEFYKYEYDFCSGIFNKKYDKNGSLKNYVNIRTFAIFVKEYIVKYKKEEKKEDKKSVVKPVRREIEHEEFLTIEDFDSVNEQILKNYKEDKFEPIIDGHDVIAPLTKRKLKKELNNIAERLVKR